MRELRYSTRSGIAVTRAVSKINYKKGLKGLLRDLDLHRGVYLSSEEERSKQPSAFSILRALIEEFRHPEDSRLALIGAFGFDLLFQFEPIEKKLPRSGHKDLHLFFCDDIYFMDRKKEQIERYQWDFEYEGLSTLALDRSAEPVISQARGCAT